MPEPAKIAGEAAYYSKRLALAVGKAAWIASTTLLVLLVPLIVEMDREQQIVEMEKGQMDVLTAKAD
jgi:import receptor subunit TOM22